MDDSSLIGSRSLRAQRGIAYLLLLVSVAVLGLTAATAVSMGVNAARRSAEYELLSIGTEFERALSSYRQAVPAGTRTGPRELNELLIDRRGGGTRRHLRKIYADPLTGRTEWGFARHPDGTIAGVFSLAPGVPIKLSGFEPRRASFDEAKRYADWVFAGF